MPFITIRHEHHHFYHADEETVMALSAEVQQLKDALDALAQRVKADSDAKNAELAALQAKVNAGTMSAEDTAALIAMGQVAAAIDPTSPVTLPPAPAATTTPAAGGTEAPK